MRSSLKAFGSFFTVNWHLKRLVAKGYVKVKRAERKKLRYIITPEGIALRARLTVNYIERSFELYRKTRQRVKSHLAEIKRAGAGHGFDVRSGQIVDVVEAGIFDPANVQRAAVSSAIASAALALTVDVLIHHNEPRQ